MEHKLISLKSAHLAYLDVSPDQPKPVLLLHGLGSEAVSWVFQQTALSNAGFRPIAIDLPGFGCSKFTGDKWSIQAIVMIVKDFIDTMRLNSIYLVGLSMGGVAALEFSIQFPGSVEKLVLINTFARFRPRSLNQGSYLLKRIIKTLVFGYKSQASDVAHRIFPKPDQEMYRKLLIEQLRKSDPGIYRSAIRCLSVYDARKKLKDLPTPTLVISGENDNTVSLRDQRALAQGIPGAIHRVISDGGHAIIIDQPERVNQDLIQFLSM